ncbi:MAG: hypothetical protein LBU61_02625 [Coriobacteriales bacterium]|jgi:hypothetical protein|nr:hypothetical protein [Coriobacteriales bacterium]
MTEAEMENIYVDYPIDEKEEEEIAALIEGIEAGTVKGFSSHAEIRESIIE